MLGELVSRLTSERYYEESPTRILANHRRFHLLVIFPLNQNMRSFHSLLLVAVEKENFRLPLYSLTNLKK